MTSSAPDRDRFRRNLRWQFIANGAQAVLGGLYLLVLGRLLGASDFGLFSTIAAFVSVAGLLVEMRLHDVVAKELHQLAEPGPPAAEAEQRIADLLALEFATRLVPAVGLVATASALTAIAHLPQNASTLLTVAALGHVLSKTGNSVATGLLRLYGRTQAVAVSQSIDWGLRLVLTSLLLVFGNAGLLAVIWTATLVGSAANLMLVRSALAQYAMRGDAMSWHKWSWRSAPMRLARQRRLLASNVGISWADLITKDADVAVLSSMLPGEKIGVYKMAKSFVQVLWRAIDPIYLAVMPEIQRLWSRGEALALRRLIATITLRLSMLSIAITVLAYAAGAWGIASVLGPDYAQVPGLMLLMSSWIVVCAPLLWGHPLAIAVDKPELALVGSAAGTLCGVAGFALLVTPLGIYGAAIGWSLSLMVGFAVTAVFAAQVARNKTPA